MSIIGFKFNANKKKPVYYYSKIAKRGKILKINLTDSRIIEMETSRFADRFLGGRGIATRI